MKVTDVEVTARRFEVNENPVSDAMKSLPGTGVTHVTVRTDEGISGEGEMYFGRIAGGPEALAALIEHELKPLVIGTDLAMVRGTHEAMLQETEYHGSFGLAMWGISALDTALWDCVGKARGVPCWQLWGAVRDRIPAYAMIGWFNYSHDEAQRACVKAIEQGFRAVKIKVGYPTLAQDIARVKAARAAIGDHIGLMVDANQSLTTAEAIRRGRAFEDLGCVWFEEALPAQDIDGYAELAAALAIPVATGENLYTAADFARFLRRDAVDIIQPDLRRCGGPSALLQIGLMAAAFGRPYASHGGDPVQLNVMACLPNTLYVETGFISADSPMKLVDGCVPLPQGPGFSW